MEDMQSPSRLATRFTRLSARRMPAPGAQAQVLPWRDGERVSAPKTIIAQPELGLGPKLRPNCASLPHVQVWAAGH